MMRLLLALALLIPALACADLVQVGSSTVCSSVSSISETKSAVCDKPTGTADGDFLVAFLWASSAQAVNPIQMAEPAGWTLIREVSAVQSTRTGAIGIYTKVASSEGASWQWDTDDDDAAAVLSMAVSVTALRGQAETQLDVTYASGSHEDTADTARITVDAPDITTVTRNALVMTFFGAHIALITDIDAPSGMSLLAENVANGRNLGVASVAQGDPGAVSPGSWNNTGSGTTTRAIGATIAIRAKPNSALRRRR